MSFVHLHVHSEYSILAGAVRVKKLAGAAAALGMKAVALTDHMNVYGAVAHSQACKKAGVKPIFGATLEVRESDGGSYNLLALVENQTGWRNLCRLLSKANDFVALGDRPYITTGMLNEYGDGLIVLAGGYGGPISTDLPQLSMQRIAELRNMFDNEHFYLERQHIPFPGMDLADMDILYSDIAQKLAVEEVLTNRVCYLKKEDHRLLTLMKAIDMGVGLQAVKPIGTDQMYLKSYEEMRALFPGSNVYMNQAVEIAGRCNFDFESKYRFPKSEAPEPGKTVKNWQYFRETFPPPQGWGILEASTEAKGDLDEYFRWFAVNGLLSRFDQLGLQKAEEERYWKRIEYELNMIQKMGFQGYLLVVAEFINWAKDNGIPVGPGRGSAAGSLVCYAMGITDLDPLRFGLLFERFLNPDRVSMPDIDTDICQERREEVVAHVREKYGADYVAQILTFGTLKPRAAVKDVARVLGVAPKDADELANMIPEEVNITLTKAMEQNPEITAAMEKSPLVKRVFDLALQVEDFPRQTGVHAAGVVIADRPMVDYMPLVRDEHGRTLTSFDMKGVEDIGLIKFDFLGLKTLDHIDATLKMVERNTGEKIDLSNIPLDDPKVFEILGKGDSMGVFQIEGQGITDVMVRLRPNRVEDLFALVALYRPGPMKAGMVDDYIDRKHGRRPIESFVPAIFQPLKPTYGCIVYQEQVMEVARIMAGYSLGEADLLRRAMGKKKPEEMAAQKGAFVQGSMKQGYSEAQAVEMFDMLEKFAGYGFNLSHSAAYGMISYFTAWLKCHHRAEFMAAQMSIESGDTDKLATYVSDAKRAGLKVIPPDINFSGKTFDAPVQGSTAVECEHGYDHCPSCDAPCVRYSLTALKGVGEAMVDLILTAREAYGGSFPTIVHLILGVPKANKRVLTALACSGALDSYLPRSQAVAVMEDVAAFRKDAAKLMKGVTAPEDEHWAKLISLFETKYLSKYPAHDLSKGQMLELERSALGLYVSDHPMGPVMSDIKRFASHTPGEAAHAGEGEKVRVAGIVSSVRVIRTKVERREMAFGKLEDPTSSIEFVLFPDAWESAKETIQSGKPIVMYGRVNERNGAMQIVAQGVRSLLYEMSKAADGVEVHVSKGEGTLEKKTGLIGIFQVYAGALPAILVVKNGETIERFNLTKYPVKPDLHLKDAVDTLFGRDVLRFIFATEKKEEPQGQYSNILD